MTERNFTKELSYYTYRDMVYGEDIESIDYPALIGIITELCDRIEKLEAERRERERQVLDNIERAIEIDKEIEDNL